MSPRRWNSRARDRRAQAQLRGGEHQFLDRGVDGGAEDDGGCLAIRVLEAHHDQDWRHGQIVLD